MRQTLGMRISYARESEGGANARGRTAHRSKRNRSSCAIPGHHHGVSANSRRPEKRLARRYPTAHRSICRAKRDPRSFRHRTPRIRESGHDVEWPRRGSCSAVLSELVGALGLTPSGPGMGGPDLDTARRIDVGPALADTKARLPQKVL